MWTEEPHIKPTEGAFVNIRMLSLKQLEMYSAIWIT
jgi:hypothetical protein